MPPCLPSKDDLSPRDPEASTLHRILREHLETFLAERAEADAPMPRFVVDELRGYLACGVLARGVALFACSHCQRSRVVGLSCKGRGLCPRCGSRRMTETARHWVRRVLPEVRIRQWVLSFPFELRRRLAFDHDDVLAVHRVVARAIHARYRDKARKLGVKSPRTGSLGVIQRFGSDLRCNVHLHDLWLDGVYADDGRFVPIAAPDRAEMAALLEVFVTRIARLLAPRRQSLGELDEPALAHATARAVSGAGANRHGPGRDGDDEHADGGWRIKARLDGFDLDATVVVAPERRERLEHLCKYLLRPPLADKRLRLLETGEVGLELKTPYWDGTTWNTMTPSTFLERVCTLVPRPGKNTILYTGVLSAHAKDREAVVPGDADTTRRHDSCWCEVSKHGIGVDVLACPCGERMRFVELVLESDRLRPLLRALGKRDEPLPLARARSPPQADLDFGP